MKPTFDLILKNATLVTFDEKSQTMITEKNDIAVLNGQIAQIGSLHQASATKVQDVNKLYLLPGLIDSQVHFREPGLTHKEDIESGSRAALLGGITSFFEMPNTNPATTTQELFEQKLKLSLNRSHTHYAFFIGGSPDNIDQLSQLEKRPHCSGIKIFLGSSFGNLLIDQDEWLEKIIINGKRRLVIHSEDEARLKERKHIALTSQNVTDHPVWRDEDSALISTKKVIALAEKHHRPVHILHVSSSEEMQFLKNHKKFATVEILPQYLLMSAPSCYEKWGTLAQQNPPIRDQRHLEHLWNAVLDGTVDVMGSDHAPHTLEEKQKPYPQSPSGVPGVQTMAVMMLNQVHQNKISIEKLTQLLTENPRRVFNLKNKGRIQVGYDADFTLVDLQKTDVIEQKWLASKSNWSPFVGEKTTGWPVAVYLNGELVMSDKSILKPHSGRACDFE